MTFNGHCLINNKKKVINLHISYKINPYLRILSADFTLNNIFSVKLIKSAYLDQYKYSHYSIGFDSLSELPFSDEGFHKNFIAFVADTSSSVHIDHKNKDILVLGEVYQYIY